MRDVYNPYTFSAEEPTIDELWDSHSEEGLEISQHPHIQEYLTEAGFPLPRLDTCTELEWLDYEGVFLGALLGYAWNHWQLEFNARQTPHYN